MENTSKNPEQSPVFTWCSTDVANCTFARRCFMTGEYCSKQERIQRDRAALHEEGEINAFVIMNFSNVSDVVYKWKIKSFVETLKNYFFFNANKSKLYCVNSLYPRETTAGEIAIQERRKSAGENNQWNELVQNGVLTKVKRINVLRADSNLSSNFVICNRVCQQLQMADLIIVDVSVKNANVFYELGMAVSLGKLILPICYSDNYFKMVPPGDYSEKEKVEIVKSIEHHIDWYPWRRELFEHFGIRYRFSGNEYTYNIEKLRQKDGEQQEPQAAYQWETKYMPFDQAVTPAYKFSDMKYDRFPYLERLDFPSLNTETGETNNQNNKSNGSSQTIGRIIYEKIAISYNHATWRENTLVIYTMDNILDETSAGQCIINYYNAIVRQFKAEQCFCGERVGVLLQPSKIPEDPKDAIQDKPLLYSVGDIIQTGVNQATYLAHMELIKPDDFLKLSKWKKIQASSELNNAKDSNVREEKETPEQREEWRENALRFIKEFLRNRSIPIYSCDPIYVKRVKDGLQTDIFDRVKLVIGEYPTELRAGESPADWFFCLYHIMLRTLRYTNQLVVDISKNTVQSLFWLGAAHGSDVYAITVCRNETEKERILLTGSPEKRERNIFDVAGLWTAIFRSDDPDGFYRQLALAQLGIEQHSRLMMPEIDYYDEKLDEYFWDNFPDKAMERIAELHTRKEDREDILLESYYRNRFWKPMLQYNRLRIYMREEDGRNKNWETRPYVLKWDMNAIAMLSNYLSKRKTIGEYQIIPLEAKQSDNDANDLNFICVGAETGPIQAENNTPISMPDYINSRSGISQHVYHRSIVERHEPATNHVSSAHRCIREYKGFVCDNNYYVTQIPAENCAHCLCAAESDTSKKFREDCAILHNSRKWKRSKCLLNNSENKHIQLAQLVLWRDVKVENATESVNYRVTISGASGPATYALSSIFVDDTLWPHKEYLPKLAYKLTAQKEKLETDQTDKPGKSNNNIEISYTITDEETKLRRFPLLMLQTSIRRQVIQTYRDSLLKALTTHWDNYKHSISFKPKEFDDDIDSQVFSYFDRVLNCAELYLSAVLYRYFMPFISAEDIGRLQNGIQMYVSSLKAANRSPFSLEYQNSRYDNYSSPMPEHFVLLAADEVSKVLRQTLESFRGVEAFYIVEIEQNYEKTVEALKERKVGNSADTRIIKGICQAKDIKTSCLFVNEIS